MIKSNKSSFFSIKIMIFFHDSNQRDLNQPTLNIMIARNQVWQNVDHSKVG